MLKHCKLGCIIPTWLVIQIAEQLVLRIAVINDLQKADVRRKMCPASEMEIGHISWILRMGLGEGDAWWYWTTLLVLRAKNLRKKLSLQL